MQAQGDARRGAYLAKAAGCAGCHTAKKEGAAPYAGGRELKTPFGIFYGPNITPHPESGIGRWSEADFLRALPPDARKNQPHELRAPYGWRFLVGAWKWLYFTPGPFAADATKPAALNRGAYLVEALGHCGECHTPRNFLGGTQRERRLAGTASGPDGKGVPNLTPAKLRKWDDRELREFLQTGLTPDGDVAAETMGEVVRNTTSQLTPEDLAALIAYLRSLPPLDDERR